MENVSICPKTVLRKGKWTSEEDGLLVAYVTRYGHWNWHELPKFAGVARCGKSCRLRWMNYLKPSIKRGNFTKEEDEVVIRMHQELGNRWSKIAANLPGRTDNEIKNHWHTRLGKHMKLNTKHVNQKRRKSVPDSSNLEPTTSDGSMGIQNSAVGSCDFSSSSADSEASTVVNSVQDHQSPVSSESFVDFGEEFWDVPFRVEDFSHTIGATSPFEETFYHCDYFDNYDMDVFFNQ